MSKGRGLRRVLRTVHLWIGLIVGVPLVVVCLSGSALVWHDTLEGWMHPERRPSSQDGAVLPPSHYLGEAAKVLVEGLLPSTLRMPAEAGAPVVVSALDRVDGRVRFTAVWLDPATGRVLDSADQGESLFGFLHRLHGSLAVPQFAGRQIVGWIGVVLLVAAVSGMWLWWPRREVALAALGWRRGLKVSANIHHVGGVWIALPLIVVTVTGIYISFPQTSRAVMGAFMDMQPQQPRAPFGRALEQPARGADEVVAGVLEQVPDGRLAVLSLPQENRPSWSVQVWTVAGTVKTAQFSVEDATGRISRADGAAGGGDEVSRLMRRIHDAQGMGPVWETLVFLTGVLPAAFAVTGVMMWLRRRGNRRKLEMRRQAVRLASGSS
ncbi:putative iron-regulated membrane protein [Skermanella aerolata]|uniref:PepSY-associated TM helix domain-containing protein n=1 Tax=Skermanella aerolata TaxID=393310 RepID=UPI003D1CB740